MKQYTSGLPITSVGILIRALFKWVSNLYCLFGKLVILLIFQDSLAFRVFIGFYILLISNTPTVSGREM
jgi:hypothetical protein